MCALFAMSQKPKAKGVIHTANATRAKKSLKRKIHKSWSKSRSIVALSDFIIHFLIVDFSIPFKTAGSLPLTSVRLNVAVKRKIEINTPTITTNGMSKT